MFTPEIKSFLDFVEKTTNTNKQGLIDLCIKKFSLTRDRSIFYGKNFAVRFSQSKSTSFGNTVISLSALQKYDNNPFFVCLVTGSNNKIYLANTTFLSKISHSSQKLRVDNISGSINGSDIIKNFEGLENHPNNFEQLFLTHQEFGFEANLVRLVEETNGIIGTGSKYEVKSRKLILESPQRAIKFVNSSYFLELKAELDLKVIKYQREILAASLINDINIRGRFVEFLISENDEEIKRELIEAMKAGQIPNLKTDNNLGDYHRNFDDYKTKTDIKTKVMVLNSSPKGYNLDKILKFLDQPETVFLFYFIGTESGKDILTSLVSMFQTDLLSKTRLIKHWAGRNSRGVSQLDGETIHKLILQQNNEINLELSQSFLRKLINTNNP